MSRNFELLQKLEQEFEVNRSREPEVQQSGQGLIDSANPTAGSSGWQAAHVNDNDAVDGEVREQVAKLVRRLFGLPGGPRVVVFSGVDPKDGCSWMTVQVAKELAIQVPGSVCVVDANFRSPSLHNYFSADNRCGLREALSERGSIRNFAQKLPIANLWLVPNGSSAANSETFSTSNFRVLMAQLRREFDYVILDTPALNLHADAIAAAQSSDGIALVVCAHSTRRYVAKRVTQDLERAGVRLLGAVLNKRRYAIPEGVLKILQ